MHFMFDYLMVTDMKLLGQSSELPGYSKLYQRQHMDIDILRVSDGLSSLLVLRKMSDLNMVSMVAA